MDNYSKHQKEFTISSYELNPLAMSGLSTLANYFQEMAYQHANLLKLGFEDLKNLNTVWMLSRLKIRVYHYPLWNDSILVETWPSGINRLFATREFRVLDKRGAQVAIASTSWLVVDLETHRPLRSGPVIDRFLEIPHGPFQFEGSLEKIPDLPDERKVLGRRVVYSDLDIVGHVNNVKYLEWCLDMMFAGGKIREIKEFEINFLHECRLDEKIMLSMSCPGEEGAGAKDYHRDCLFNGIRDNDGVEVFRARARW